MTDHIQLSMFDAHKKSYFNTTKLGKDELREANKKAVFQDAQILEIFREYKILPPSKAWEIYRQKFGEILLTSIRRSITNLTNSGKLIKTSAKDTSPYGRPEYIWKLS